VVKIVEVFMNDYGANQDLGLFSGVGVGLLLLPIIFYPILAFGDAEYVGRE
jgi:hypothetical protein